MTWGWLIFVLPFGLLGLLAGRYTKLLVLVLLPIPVFWVLYETSYKGEGDDITGPATTFLAILAMGAFIAGALVMWCIRNADRIPRND